MDHYRQNLRFLVQMFKWQTALARRLGGWPTQSVISVILGGKRSFYPWEAAPIERTLGIPKGWLKEDELVSFFWPFIQIINHCDTLDLPLPYDKHLQEMKDRLPQLGNLLKRSRD